MKKDHTWPKVYIILVNWNGWRDTIECLESVLRIDYPNYQVIIVDNGSSDESVSRIKAWSIGEIAAEVSSKDNRIIDLVFPPVPKPIALTEINGEKKENHVLLIKSEKNLGFAGGNNLGLNYALKQNDFGYVWLLNNDTVVRADTLMQMVKRMKEKPGAGICGSAVLHYHNPDTIWALGGKYDKWFAQGFHLEGDKPFDYKNKEKYLKYERKISYVVGASMLVSREFLQDIGLLCEDYFLFFEELDWRERARRRYELAIAPSSIVYHKGGASINRQEERREKAGRFGLLFDYYQTRNRLLFTLKFHPYALPILYLSIIGYIIDRLRMREWENAWTIFKVAAASVAVPLRGWLRHLRQ